MEYVIGIIGFIIGALLSFFLTKKKIDNQGAILLEEAKKKVDEIEKNALKKENRIRNFGERS